MSRGSTAPVELQDAVGQRRLAVVDVADDREVPDAVGGDRAGGDGGGHGQGSYRRVAVVFPHARGRVRPAPFATLSPARRGGGPGRGAPVDTGSGVTTSTAGTGAGPEGPAAGPAGGRPGTGTVRRRRRAAFALALAAGGRVRLHLGDASTPRAACARTPATPNAADRDRTTSGSTTAVSVTVDPIEQSGRGSVPSCSSAEPTGWPTSCGTSSPGASPRSTVDVRGVGQHVVHPQPAGRPRSDPARARLDDESVSGEAGSGRRPSWP